MEIDQLIIQLESGEKTYEDVAAFVYSNGTKPWETVEWKKKRQEIIKNECQQCGSTEQPFVLQHTWHPTSYDTYIRKYYDEYYQLHNQRLSEKLAIPDKKVESYIIKNGAEREACPKCQSVNIQKRKTLSPLFKCNKCHFEFEDTIKVTYFRKHKKVLSPEQIKNIMLGEKIKDYMWNTYGEEIRKAALIQSMKDHKRYMSLQDTVTFCKKCAYLWDMKWKKLCPICKKNYISLHSGSCSECNSIKTTIKG